MFWLTSFKDGDVDDIEYCRRVIDVLVNKVFVYDSDDGGRRIVIVFNTSDAARAEVKFTDFKGGEGFVFNALGSTIVCKNEPLILLSYNVFAYCIEIESVM